MAYIDKELFKQDIKMRSADVAEVKHGHWVANASTHISKRGRLINYNRYKCSECGKWNGRHKPKHCPDCGAKMDVPDTNVGEKGDAYEKSKM